MQVDRVHSELCEYTAWRCRNDDASDGLSYRVLMAGDGPPVIVMHELSGMGAPLLELARTVRDAGYRTWLPVFFEPADRPAGVARGIANICIRREFNRLALGRTTPLTAWLRDLVAHVTQQTSDEPTTAARAAVIGMCMTGGLVFGLVSDDRVAAAVAAQPSLPWRPRLPVIGALGAGGLGTPDDLLPAPDAQHAPVMVLRFRDDPISPRERMDAARDTFATQACRPEPHEALDIRRCGRFTSVEAPGRHHATLTYDAARAGCHPTRRVLAFLAEHLPA